MAGISCGLQERTSEGDTTRDGEEWLVLLRRLYRENLDLDGTSTISLGRGCFRDCPQPH